MITNIQDNDVIVESNEEFGLHCILDEKFGAFKIKKNKSCAFSSLKGFIKKHPFLTGAAISLGTSALASYNRNKNVTARFFAQNAYERKLYQDISDNLIASGHYKMVRKKYINGGLMYELVQG